jgi:hypothetical protein
MGGTSVTAILGDNHLKYALKTLPLLRIHALYHMASARTAAAILTLKQHRSKPEG